MSEFLTKQLVEDIKTGGLIIAPCSAGKTTAVIEVLKTNYYFYLVVDNDIIRKHYWMKGAPIEQIITIEEYDEYITQKICHVKVSHLYIKFIIDEYFISSPMLQGINFHAALTTPDRLPVIMYNETGERLYLEPANLFRGKTNND